MTVRVTGPQRWYRKNIKYSRERKARRRREFVRWVYEHKRDNCECARCDEDDKEFSVSRRANRGHAIENCRFEIDRCQVLCANCHRKEHYEPQSRPDESDRI